MNFLRPCATRADGRNAPVDHLVDLQAQLLGDLCLPGLQEAAHEALQVLSLEPSHPSRAERRALFGEPNAGEPAPPK